MGDCGCGGASNVYKEPTAKKEKRAAVTVEGSRPGWPAVWNGPKPKQAA